MSNVLEYHHCPSINRGENYLKQTTVVQVLNAQITNPGLYQGRVGGSILESLLSLTLLLGYISLLDDYSGLAYSIIIEH